MQVVQDYYRFCPDQPKALLSDAICLGRRRSRYPQCPGCRFNDDASGEFGVVRPGPAASANQSDAISQVFQEHQVRGQYPDVLYEKAAWRIGHATALYLRSMLRGVDRGDPVATTVVGGRDMRDSSPALCAAFLDGARSTGANVVDIGLIDTPQLYFAVNHLRSCGGVQTTGSHLPADFNGFKIVGRGGREVGEDSGLTDIFRIARNMVKHDTGQKGALRKLDLTHDYKAFIRGHLLAPKPLRVVVDASNGMAASWVEKLLGDVAGLELICLNAQHEGRFAHPPDPLDDDNLGELCDRVRSEGADVGVCFDGDADQVVFVDQSGRIIRNDIMTALLARQLLGGSPGATVVYDLRSSRVVAEEIKAAGGVPRRERVGGAYIQKALTESKGVFGGDLQGRFYFRENYCCDSGLLALVQVLNLLTQQAQPLGELVSPLLRYVGVERGYDVAKPEACIRQLAKAYGDARVDFLDGITVQKPDWWFNLRQDRATSQLRLRLEATTSELAEQTADEVGDRLAAVAAAR
ncbi:MAG: phosphomannomutase/phosphoglucomutase [Planctomycetes bacterium]|nr:phosphomannomutase/phosphoglucomutase [Planctomycetota bacterium]